ncbi:MAG: tryptophan--tRNA ligase [Candidatus Andersenbacteria bacterium]
MPDKTATTKTALTGLQPSGELHLGNYIGAVEQVLELQKSYETVCFVADLHAMTVPYKADELRARTRDLARILLAAGVDPDKTLLFVQSHVPAHVELAWILSTQLPVAELERMTQYKEKVQQRKPTNAGLLNYPTLMAADILMYNVDLVPVGQDQAQHVELARVAARKFNTAFGETFALPKASLRESALIRGTDGDSKMSKSIGNTLPLLAEPEEVRKRVRKAMVNPPAPTSYEGVKPITIFEWHDAQFPSAETTKLSHEARVENKHSEQYKELVAANISTYLAPLQKRYKEIVAKGDADLDRVLEAGAVEARARAERMMEKVRKHCGLR